MYVTRWSSLIFIYKRSPSSPLPPATSDTSDKPDVLGNTEMMAPMLHHMSALLAYYFHEFGDKEIMAAWRRIIVFLDGVHSIYGNICPCWSF